MACRVFQTEHPGRLQFWCRATASVADIRIANPRWLAVVFQTEHPGRRCACPTILVYATASVAIGIGIASPRCLAVFSKPHTPAGGAPALQFWCTRPHRLPTFESQTRDGVRCFPNRTPRQAMRPPYNFGEWRPHRLPTFELQTRDGLRCFPNRTPRQAVRLPYNFGVRDRIGCRHSNRKPAMPCGLFQTEHPGRRCACPTILVYATASVADIRIANPRWLAAFSKPNTPAGGAPALQFWCRATASVADIRIANPRWLAAFSKPNIPAGGAPALQFWCTRPHRFPTFESQNSKTEYPISKSKTNSNLFEPHSRITDHSFPRHGVAFLALHLCHNSEKLLFLKMHILYHL